MMKSVNTYLLFDGTLFKSAKPTLKSLALAQTHSNNMVSWLWDVALLGSFGDIDNNNHVAISNI
eukprot:1255623-Amphidinium_carterae.1